MVHLQITMKNYQRNINTALLIFCVFLNLGTTHTVKNSGLSTRQPLFLTPYIESGDIATGRALSRVGRLPNAPRDVPSYSGYFTVNKEYNSNLFFWFFPAMNADNKAPFILWLQGGPGQSGLLALFVENGPYFMHNTTTVGLREHTWNKEFHVLYVDSPVGAGFSFTDDERGYATNQDQVTDGLYEFLQQFFQVYYEYSECDFYIAGESYGGKHVPYLGYTLHVDGPPAGINFKGVSIGNGYFDIHMYNHFEDYLYQLGVIDYKQTFYVRNIYNELINHHQKGERIQAAKVFNKFFVILKDPDVDTTSFLTTFSGYNFFYNFLITERPEVYSYHVPYIQSEEAREAIHVGNRTFHDLSLVKHHIKTDIVTSSSLGKISALLEERYKVLVYNGQFDFTVPYVASENLLLNNVTWSHSEDYRMADRKIWKVGDGDYVAGYVRNFGNLTGILVRNAGHLVPCDQPEVALELITNFIKDIPFA